MRIRTLSVLVIAAMFGLSACSGDATPSPNSNGQTAEVSTKAAAPNTLHWDESAPPANLDTLRRAVEEIGYALSQDGYTPVAESVDSPDQPSVLVTHWLKGDTMVDLHSQKGVTAISLLRTVPDSPDPQGKLWIRCEAASGAQGDVIAEIKSLQQEPVASLNKANGCYGVTWDIP